MKRAQSYVLTAATLALFASLPAQAEIYYSGIVDQTIFINTLTSPAATLNVSMDGDNAFTDFILTVTPFSFGTPEQGATGTEVYTDITAGSGTLLDQNSPLAFGTEIGPEDFSLSGSDVFPGFYLSEITYDCSNGPPCPEDGQLYYSGGGWPNDGVTSGYLGLSFIRNDQTYYGWAEIISNVSLAQDLSSGSASLELVEVAFNTNAGDPIAAGETPEPTTAALLASAAIALSAIRRRNTRAAD